MQRRALVGSAAVVAELGAARPAPWRCLVALVVLRPALALSGWPTRARSAPP